MTVITEVRKKQLEESFRQQGLMTTFQARFDLIEYGHTIISMPYSDGISQQHQFFHGGVIGSLVDSACGYAAISTVAEGQSALTSEYKINFLAPADGERLEAHGRIVKAGKTLIVCQGDVYIYKQGAKKHCATILMTMCVVKNLGNL
jgi:uncharacterized protein (TIGR00369 family)